jgi:hypothetical protein
MYGMYDNARLYGSFDVVFCLTLSRTQSGDMLSGPQSRVLLGDMAASMIMPNRSRSPPYLLQIYIFQAQTGP